MNLFHETSIKISGIVTKKYSNSFFLSTKLLDYKTKEAIHGIYGFVRYADEIVDTFQIHDKSYLLQKFENDMYEAIDQRISLNPILDSFQLAVNTYNIPIAYVESFLKSMKMDLTKTQYVNQRETTEYIYGSANVVGLMCLKVFCRNDIKLFEDLQYSAQMLGSAFQKVNFLRDLKSDTEDLGRNYFSDYDKKYFDDSTKMRLVSEIETEFKIALNGIKKLPGRSKLAVVTAYLYYNALLNKIKRTQAKVILDKRIRISNIRKMSLMARAIVEYKIGLI